MFEWGYWHSLVTMSTQIPNILFSQHPLIDTRDLDEGRLMLCRLYGQAQLDFEPDRRAFHWQSNSVSLGPIRLAASWVPEGAAIQTETNADRFILLLTTHGGAAAVQDGQKIRVETDRTGLLLPPERRGSVHILPDSTTLTLTVERAAVEAHFVKLTHAPLRAPLLCQSRVDVAAGPGAGLARLIHFVAKEMDHPAGLLATPQLRASLTDALLTALLTCTNPTQDQIAAASGRPVTPGVVRRAQAYIEAHVGDPITVTDIAQEVGVSVRALQASFAKYLGVSPHQYLTGWRLDLARRQLLDAQPNTSVAQIAAGAGFPHPSQFAAAYRRRFDETPVQTRRLGPGRGDRASAVGPCPSVRPSRDSQKA